MPWWIPEIARVVFIVTGAIGVQQLIRRHGVAYVAEVFRATPRAGVAFVALADIAYYLIIVAFTFFTVRVDGGTGKATLAQLQEILASIGALALIIGGLHVFNVFLLPAVGRSLARDVGMPPDTAISSQAAAGVPH
jgi:hypothetical protein